jgi:multidrug resistance efflux pump
MDVTDLEIALDQAQQSVIAQQAILDELLRGPSDQVVARAERENAHQVAEAELALQASAQQLEQARAQDPAGDVAVAEARVRQLDRQLARARAQDPAPEITMAQVELERAQIWLDETQDEYGKALDRPWEDQEIRDALAKQLKQAQLNYRLAQAQLARAQKAWRAHALGLEVLEAQLEEAEALLAQTVDREKRHQGAIGMLETEREVAQRRLEYLRAWENPYLDGPSQEQIAQAYAHLEQAKLSAVQIEQQIADSEVRAPYNGTVSTVHVRAGEFLAPGQPLLVLGDLAALRAETTDLSERDVDKVTVGQGARVYVEALGTEIVGRVEGIAPEATTVGGDVVYQVTVQLDEQLPGLRWGMSADVEIATE